MKTIILACLSLVLFTGCASQATFGDAIVEGEPTPLPTAVVPTRPIYDVQRGDIIDQRSYSGRISAVRSDALAFPLDGRVRETYVQAGQDVVTGDVLAELDTSQLERDLLNAEEALAVAQSLLDAAENQIAFARRRAELDIELAQVFLDAANAQEDELLIRQREIELAQAELALEQLAGGVDPALSFDVARAQERVDELNNLLADTVLRAPMDGRLASFLIAEGDPVVAFETVGLVADLSELEVTDAMENPELSELTEGLPVVLQRFNAPDAAFDASIRQLPQPFGTGDDSLIHIQFEEQPPPGEFELGARMSFTVTIAEREDVLFLPVSAIRQFAGRNFVVVQDEGVERRVDVQLGLEGGDRVEVVEGLEAGQRVIAP